MASRWSMRAQTSVIIAAAFILSHVVGYLIYSYEREDALEIAGAADITERAADVSRLLEDLPATWQAAVVRLLNSRTFQVWVSDEPEFEMDEPSGAEADLLDYLRLQVPRALEQDARVSLLEPAPDRSTLFGRISPQDAPSVAISIRHGEKNWLNVLGAISTPDSFIPGLLLANIASAAVGLALVAFWLVSRVTAPLVRLSEAADALGRNLQSPPLDVSGPREVAVAALAFNRMQARLVHLIKNRTEFLAAISHDLRTPLTQVRLRTEMMPNSMERQKNLKAFDEMEAIIGTFLAYARAAHETERVEKSDIGALVDSVCDDLSDCGAAIECESEPNLVISCKRMAIKRAVVNVIENALKYGGHVRVATKRSGAGVVVTIDDNGPGIPPSELEAVFAPFYRGEKSRTAETGSVGLGLSIAQAIVEDHGGTLRLSNRPKGGLCAEIILPA